MPAVVGFYSGAPWNSTGNIFLSQGKSGEEVALEDFCYSGPKPQSKETAIVMMADTVEAAVRAMTDYSASKVETLIRKLIRAKFDDEQFDECDLTIKDMNTIAVTFKNVISGIFHERGIPCSRY